MRNARNIGCRLGGPRQLQTNKYQTNQQQINQQIQTNIMTGYWKSVPKSTFYGLASWQSNIRWPAMPETRWPNMAALLWVLVPLPAPQRVGDPYSKVENSKLSYRAHRMLIRKLLTRKTALCYWWYSIANIFFFWKYRRKTKLPSQLTLFRE